MPEISGIGLSAYRRIHADRSMRVSQHDLAEKVHVELGVSMSDAEASIRTAEHGGDVSAHTLIKLYQAVDAIRAGRKEAAPCQ